MTARKTPPMDEAFDKLLENLDGMDLTQALVRREHHYIDVLLTNEDHHLAVIVENKIDAWGVRANWIGATGSSGTPTPAGRSCAST